MRALLAFAALVAALPAAATSYGDLAAAWGYADDDTSMTLVLWPSGDCQLEVLDKNTGAGHSTRCHYWIHGSRVRLRGRGERDGTGANTLDIEFVPQTGTMLLHGPSPAIFKRQPASLRED